MWRVQDSRGEWSRLDIALDDGERRDRQKAWRDDAGMHNAPSLSNTCGPRRILLAVVGVFAAVAVMFVSAGAIGFGLFTAIGTLVCIAMGGLTPVMMNEARRQAIQSLEICLGDCPSCDDDMRGLPRDADQCVVCPECGGAWRQGS